MLIVYPHRRYCYYPRPAWQPAQSEKVFAVKAIATCSAYPHIVRGFFGLFTIEGVGVRRRVAGRMRVEVPQGWEF